MSTGAKLARLQDLTRLMLDLRLMELERSARARQASLDHLADLNRPQPPADANPVVAGEVAMRFQTWADQRRTAINLDLARQTVDWEEAKRSAALAFGRDTMIGKLRDRKD
jgi:hypothetical protein